MIPCIFETTWPASGALENGRHVLYLAKPAAVALMRAMGYKDDRAGREGLF
jgi:hypothetical protein